MSFLESNTYCYRKCIYLFFKLLCGKDYSVCIMQNVVVVVDLIHQVLFRVVGRIREEKCFIKCTLCI